MIKTTCPCGKSFLAKPEYAGRRVKCPGCQNPLMVPDTAGDGAASPARPDKSPRTAAAAAAADGSSGRSGHSKSAAPADPKSAARATAGKADPGRAGSGKSKPPSTSATAAGKSGQKSSRKVSREDDFAEEDDPYADSYGAYDDHEAPPTKLPPRKSSGPSAPVMPGASDTRPKAAPVESPPMSKGLIWSFVGVGVLVVGLIAFFVVRSVMNAEGTAQAGRPSAIPKAWKPFKHHESMLSVQAPDDWALEKGGGTGGMPPWMKITNDDAGVSISIRGDVAATAVTDIAASGVSILDGAPGAELPDDLDPVVAGHNYAKEKFAANYNEYTESEPVKIKSGFGEGRMCSFEGSGAILSEYGYRATLLANQYQYNVILKCPKGKLAVYKPVFETLVQSIGP